MIHIDEERGLYYVRTKSYHHVWSDRDLAHVPGSDSFHSCKVVSSLPVLGQNMPYSIHFWHNVSALFSLVLVNS